jgi:hypothetical protein
MVPEVDPVPRAVTRLTAPPSAFRPSSEPLPERISIRWMWSIGSRSKLTCDASGSFIRTPSRNTATPCGSPTTGEEKKPRLDRLSL